MCCATDEDSPFDPADENKEAEGKEKKLEEAGDGVYPLRVFMGRLVRDCHLSIPRKRLTARSIQVAYGKARQLIQKFIVKERKFYGNTSMESEMSLLMAGQTLVRCDCSLSGFKK